MTSSKEDQTQVYPICLIVLSLSCFFVNGTILSKILTRPKLWSTINTFLIIMLFCNFVIGTFEFSLPVAGSIYGELDKNTKLYFCTATILPLQFHRVVTLKLSIWLVFFRSMMIKRADDIQIKITKDQRAKEVNGLGLLVALICGAWVIIYVLIIFFHPDFPTKFDTVRMCRGLIPFQNMEHEKSAGRQILIWNMLMIIAGFFVYSSHIRIRRYRATHGSSYFTRNRQNIATVNQTLFCTYVKLFLNDTKLAIIYISRSFGSVDYETIIHFYLLIMAVDSVFIPLHWLHSIRRDFPELWYPSRQKLYMMTVISNPEVEEKRSARKMIKIPRRPAEEKLKTKILNSAPQDEIRTDIYEACSEVSESVNSDFVDVDMEDEESESDDASDKNQERFPRRKEIFTKQNKKIELTEIDI